jgi:hypothetical protein
MQISITGKGFKLNGKQHFFGKLAAVLSGLTKGDARKLRKSLWNAGFRRLAATTGENVKQMPKEKIRHIA